MDFVNKLPVVVGVLILGCLHSYASRYNNPNVQCRNREGHQTWDHSIMNLTFIRQPFPDQSVFRHNQNANCPTYDQLITYNHLGAQNLSLCPWTTEINHDFHRFPHNMTYARCSCKRCVTWDQSGNRHECVAHYHTFKVIRRECQPNGDYRYFYTTEHLPIACVCSHESVHLVDTSD